MSVQVASTVSKSQEVEYLDITVLGSWGPKEAPASIHAANSASENGQIGCEKPYPPPVSFPKITPQISPFRPQRRRRAPTDYEEELGIARKRGKHLHWTQIDD